MRVRFVIASVILRANRSDVDLLQPILSIAVTSYWTPHYNQSAPIQSATNWLWIDCRPCCTQSSLPCWDVRLLSFSWLSSLTQPSANCLCCLHVADIINLSLLSVRLYRIASTKNTTERKEIWNVYNEILPLKVSKIKRLKYQNCTTCTWTKLINTNWNWISEYCLYFLVFLLHFLSGHVVTCGIAF